MAKKIECCTCGNTIEESRVKSKQSLCRLCQNEYLRKNRPKFKDLTGFAKIKAAARLKANIYRRRGKIKKTNCVSCGDVKSQMHHDDYNKPLDVVWFCRKCHLEYHKNNPNVLR
jgi:hypothetical protein